jgi:hypothetical protein
MRRVVRQEWPAGYRPPREVEAIHPSASWGRPTPCGTYTHLRWPEPDGPFAGFDSFEWDLTPELDTSQGYFWAHQFALRGSGTPQSGGYVGLQANGVYPPGRPTKVAIFSIWNALDARGTGIAQPFGGEGTGYQTLVRWAWVAGRRYHLRINAVRTEEEGGNWWVGTVREGATDAEVEIGRIRVPDLWNKLDAWSVVWTELFSPTIRRCTDMECASSLWANFTANRGTLRPTSIDSRFSARARCTNSRIGTLADGTVRQQMGLPAPASP